MRKFSTVSWLLLVLVVSALPSAAEDLSQILLEELGAPDGRNLSPELKERFSGKIVLFVGGFLNEAIVGYFDDSRRVLKEQCGNPLAPRALRPSSRYSVAKNAERLGRRLREIHRMQARRSGVFKPLIVIGHSKGAAEAVAAVLQDPGLILGNIVERVVAVQGTFGGSLIADLAVISPGDFRNPLRNWAGLSAITTDKSERLFSALTQLAQTRLSPEDYGELSSRVLYVRSAQTEGLTILLRQTHLLIELLTPRGEDSANDGLLLTQAQKLQNFGVDLGTIDADHSDLFQGKPYSNSSQEYRRAFTRAIVRSVAE